MISLISTFSSDSKFSVNSKIIHKIVGYLKVMPKVLSPSKGCLARPQDTLPTLKIDLVSTKSGNQIPAVTRSNSDVHLSVCIQDIPASPTQHAEFTLPLVLERNKKKSRLRKQPVTDIHACFDVNDINGSITVVDESEALTYPASDKHCHRYERDSIDLLERYDQLRCEHQSPNGLSFLTSPHHKLSHSTRLSLLEYSCSR